MILDYLKDHLDLVVATISCVAAIASALAAFASRNTAEKALQFQSRMGLYETLKSCAERANGYAKGKNGADWDFNDAANIVRSMNLAMKTIHEHTQHDNEREINEFKRFFLNQLNMELFKEVNYGVGPDALFHNAVESSVDSEIYNQWIDVINFFNLMIATDADLAD
ncbi:MULTISPECIES: hypothetical protein [Serratia]|uniref:hypothetical protein n=1 Tax=Serratia TaxID=613 RepID=UPI0009312F13|nr:hypothetical protein [Serratia marcescens]ELN4520398.1 hypothetical protein [Serratia marcescens]HBC0576343.1 hypothetical protein [Serratia marcescens]HEJ7006406.1 hypothetical protein [Serratia marcescens]